MRRRLAPRDGEWIDRSHRLPFSFEGVRYEGFAGDLVNSALLANDVRIVGRSFKYHRPRGLYSLANHDVNGLFSDGIHTHLRGDQTPLRANLALRAVNTIGGLRNDRMRFASHLARFMPVGFYYKGFFKPRGAFPFYEKLFRRAAGLGEVRRDAPPPKSPKDYAWCDVLVVGSGPSGLAAALAAAEAGAKILLVEEQTRLGGSFYWSRAESGLDPRLAEWELALISMKIARRRGTFAAGAYADGWIALVDDRRLTKLRAKAVVYATGAIEQPAVFQNNDLPGVMLASAAQRLIHQYAVKPFDTAVMLVANPDGYRAALDLLAADVTISAIADLRVEGESSALGKAVADAGIPVFRGWTLYALSPSRGHTGVCGAELRPLGAKGEAQLHRAKRFPCDGVAISVGFAPNAALLYQAGAELRYDERIEQYVPRTLPRGVHAAGRVNGVFELERQIADGRRAGIAAARDAGYAAEAISELPTQEPARSHAYPIFSHPEHKNFVDFDEDVHLDDLVNAHQEGYDSVELMKRYTTLGMGPSQGMLANMNGVRVLSRLNGTSINETGTTTSRPFVHPVPIGHLAGRRFHPMRHTPMHDWHAEHGAEWVHAGTWYRPEFYHRGKESRAERIVSEARAVRSKLGLIDLSTLGKLWIVGPDAVEFLERIYTARFKKLAVGRQRYAVALDESGVVIEDGVVARISNDRFYVTTTSGGADTFYREMQRWVLVWGLNVILVNVTGCNAAMNLAGPKSRQTLATLTPCDLSEKAFPYLGVRETEVAGVPAILLRAGFVGELGYELHVPASRGMHVWMSILKAGTASSIEPFGVEAQRLLRLEKGHPIVGHDTDALTVPGEAALGWAIAKEKPFFVGQRSLSILDNRPRKRILVGIRWPNGYHGPLPEECQLVVRDGGIAGRVTSIAPQSTLGYPLGIAFVHPELAEPGTRVTVRLCRDRSTEATVTPLCHYDPENERQKG